jgi:hypothetical protein
MCLATSFTSATAQFSSTLKELSSRGHWRRARRQSGPPVQCWPTWGVAFWSGTEWRMIVMAESGATICSLCFSARGNAVAE